MVPIPLQVPRNAIYSTAKVTVSLIAVNLAIFLYQVSLPTYELNIFVTQWGIVPDRLRLISLITSMFLHGGWLHVLGNMLFLWGFRPQRRRPDRRCAVPGVVSAMRCGGGHCAGDQQCLLASSDHRRERRDCGRYGRVFDQISRAPISSLCFPSSSSSRRWRFPRPFCSCTGS